MPPKTRQRRNQREVSVHTEHSHAESAVNVQGQDQPQPLPSDPNREAPPTNLLLELIQNLQQNQRSALVHISKFIDSMGAYAGNGDLCLREFSKSLDDRAYTWYTTLPPGSVKAWEDMVELFCGKYFQAEEKITLVNLHTTKQTNGEDLLRYIHRFHDISLDCYANYEEGELVGVCIDNMLPEFRAHLENLDISRFAQLLQKARKTALSVKSFEEPPPPVPCTLEEMMAILDKWVANGIVKLPEISKKVTEEDKKNPKFCYFHQYVHHSTADCWTLRRKFHEKIQDGTLELPQARQKVNIDPFLKHKEKGAVSVVIHGSASDADMDELVAANSAVTPAAIKTLQRNPRFCSFFNQLGLNPEACTAATEAIMAITADSKAHYFTAETHASRAFLETTNAITFTNENMEVQYPDHRRPLYLSATINEVQVRRALVDTGSCINLIPLSTIQAAEISQKKIQGAPMEIKGFGGVGEYTKGHIQLVLKIGPIVALTRFHVVDSVVPYHILLGRPWLHKHQLIPSTYHQCVKGRLNGKPIRIAANSTPFDQSESHFEEIKDAPEADLRDLLERKKKRKTDASASKRANYPQQEAPEPGERILQPSCLTVNATDVSESADTAEPVTADPTISAKEELEVINLSSDPNVHRPVSISASLSVEERMHLVELLKEYQDVFAWQYDEMPGIDPKLVAHSLNVEPGTRPVVQPMRTFHPEVEAQITQEVKKLLSVGFIKPILHPRWLSNIVPVKKKNGQIRCCVDFHNLNKACPKDEFPLPNMDLLIDSAAGHAMFSFMDGFSGYNQIFMSPRDAEKTAFRTPIGNFYYTVMPFGLKNAGATYQRTMTAMFHDMMHREIEDYVDDIVVKSKTREDHFGILKKVFKRCRLYKLKMNPLKCAFGVSAGKFLGFLVHQHGIDVDPVKASTIATMKPPTTHKELKSFLGKLSYIRRLAQWLLQLSQYEIIAETPTAIKSQAIADLLAQFPGEDNSFITDEVPGEINEVFLAAEYEAYLAGLAIAYEMGIKHLRVIGDSNLVKEFEELSPDQEDWRAPIKAKLMSPAVTAELKREIKDYTLISGDLYRRLPGGKQQRYRANAQLANSITAMKRLALRYFVEGGTLFRKGFHGEPLRCLSLSESQMVMKETHAGECGEHQGKKRLYQCLLTLGYYWPTMKKDAADFVKTCHTCQVQANLIHTHPTSLQNMATPWPFHTWGLDLIGPINPASGGYIWILVATEYFTKWVEAIPLQKATSAAVANFIREHIITHFGIPYKLITDNGTPFINKDVREVLEHYRVKHRRSTPYYPQGNGQAEATNRMLLRILSKMVFDYGNDWKAHLADVLWAYRSSPKTATGFTPFSLVYGTDTISPTELVVPSPRVMQGSELEVDANICAEARMADLEGLDEARDLAKAKSQRNYQKIG
uniref:Integrase catalytic domain-containing protein n=1 Tax=Fagus sylvatica TaxID=28930 RepID=A0A2N9HCW8_FAGSY